MGANTTLPSRAVTHSFCSYDADAGKWALRMAGHVATPEDKMQCPRRGIAKQGLVEGFSHTCDGVQQAKDRWRRIPRAANIERSMQPRGA